MKRFSGGYSLIELLIYLAIFAAISIIVIHSLITVMRTYAQAATYRRLQSNGEIVMERIVREVRQASAVTTGSSTFGSNPGRLTLTGTDANDSAHTVLFDVSSGVVRVTDNGVLSALTTGEVTATTLIFRNITTPVGNAIKVELTLTTAKGSVMSSNFYSTINLRGK